MTEKQKFRGGKNIAMKVPPRQFQAVVDSYRALELPILYESPSMVTFEFGPVNLHVDSREHFSQAELWLEFIVDDTEKAKQITEAAGFARCDEIENLAGHTGFWVANPASIVHLVTTNE